MRCWIFWIFATVYVLALAVLIVGTFGLFGQEADPISGVFLIPLGFPWFYLVSYTPEAAWPWLTALAPMINLYLIVILCRFLRRR